MSVEKLSAGKQYAFYLVFLYLAVMVIGMIVCNASLNGINADNDAKIASLPKDRFISPADLCIAVGCEYIKSVSDEEAIFSRYSIYDEDTRSSLQHMTVKEAIQNSDKYWSGHHTIVYGDWLIVINNEVYKRAIVRGFEKSIYLLLFPIIFSFLYLTGRRRMAEDTVMIVYKQQYENKLQSRLAESLYHELNGPIAIISAVIEDNYTTLFPCRKYEGMLCRLISQGNCPEKNEICMKRLAELPGFDKNYAMLQNNIGRINSVLTMLANTKAMKRGNDASILKLIATAEENLKLTSIRKVVVRIKDKEYLDRIYLANLAAGNFLNILNILFTNSIEANATYIAVSVSQKNGTAVTLTVTDNGTGIKNIPAGVDISRSIFNYGVSFKNNKTVITGVGLYMAMNLLTEAGGDIKIRDTSDKGTSFDMVVITTTIQPKADVNVAS